MIGVYKITNIRNGKSYIGSSVDIDKRWKRHKTAPFNPNDTAYEYPLYQDMRAYGLSNFQFDVIELCKKDQLEDREKYWISYYNTYADGYNQTLGGRYPAPVRVTPEMLESITEDLRKDPFVTHQDLGLKYGLSAEMIQGINTGRYWHRDLDYPLQQSRADKQRQCFFTKVWLCKFCGSPVSKQNDCCVTCAHIQSRVAARPNREVLIREIAMNGFEAVGRKYGVSGKAVAKWCRYYNLPSHKNEIVQIYKNMGV